MSRFDLSRRQASRAELDQRSRATRLELERLQRIFAVRIAVAPSRGRDGRTSSPAGSNILPIPLRRVRGH
ncbi:MAG TPA: hypothetical protein VGF34_08400 [Stellaceae bacterium]|jgi:hypothetical protein